MARGVQQPDRAGEVAAVLKGKEGVGKGVLAKYYGRCFGSHFRHIAQASHLTGKFNSHLQHCSCLFADEAFFAGDRSHELILKAIITEETLMIEPKGLDAYPVRNCIRLIMSSNSDWVVPAGADARRYFVLNVSDAKKQDPPTSRQSPRRWKTADKKRCSIFFSIAIYPSSMSETFRRPMPWQSRSNIVAVTLIGSWKS